VFGHHVVLNADSFALLQVPASGRTSETGTGSGVASPRSELPSESSSTSIGSRRVQGIPELPPRHGKQVLSGYRLVTLLAKHDSSL
jgi:hypothetical protein